MAVRKKARDWDGRVTPNAADRVAMDTVMHALRDPADGDRWAVAADAAEEATWPSSTVSALKYTAHALRGKCLLVLDFAKLAGSKRDDVAAPLRLWKVWKGGRRALFVMQPEDLVPVAVWLPSLDRRSIEGPPNVYGAGRRPYVPDGQPFEAGRSSFVGFEACTLGPGETMITRCTAAARLRFVQLIIPLACADALLVSDITVNSESLLAWEVPASVFAAHGLEGPPLGAVVEPGTAIEVTLINITDRDVFVALGALVREEANPPAVRTVGGFMLGSDPFSSPFAFAAGLADPLVSPFAERLASTAPWGIWTARTGTEAGPPPGATPATDEDES